MLRWSMLMLPLLAVGCRRGDADQPLSHWADQLHSSDVSVRLHAVDMLARDGWDAKEVVPPLIAALADENDEVAAKGSEALRKLGAPASDALIETLKDKDARVRARAVQTLGAISPMSSAVQTALAKTLADPNVTVRLRAIEALDRAGVHSDSVIQSLADVLKDDSEVVRYSAASALGKGGPAARAAAPALRALLNDPDDDVRRAAQHALQRIE